MDQYLPAAIKRLNIQPEQVVKSRIDGSELVVLVDYGIGGIKKYRLPVAGLVEVPEPEPEPEPVAAVEVEPEPEMVVPPGQKDDVFVAGEAEEPKPEPQFDLDAAENLQARGWIETTKEPEPEPEPEPVKPEPEAIKAEEPAKPEPKKKGKK